MFPLSPVVEQLAIVTVVLVEFYIILLLLLVVELLVVFVAFDDEDEDDDELLLDELDEPVPEAGQAKAVFGQTVLLQGTPVAIE